MIGGNPEMDGTGENGDSGMKCYQCQMSGAVICAKCDVPICAWAIIDAFDPHAHILHGVFSAGKTTCAACDEPADVYIPGNDTFHCSNHYNALKKTDIVMLTCGCSICQNSLDVPVPPKPPKSLRHTFSPVTQKALGVYRLGRVGGPLDTTICTVSTVYPTETTTLPDFPFFARPCPFRPRHGFVDSRIVANAEEFDNLVEEVKIASGSDPWEILLSPYIHAKWSAIVTDAGVSLGPGNTGATAGENSLAIPAPSRELTEHIGGQPQNFFGISESPYLEVVAGRVGGETAASGNRAYVVQIRDGPKPVLSDRFVPASMVVGSVVEAGGDLLQWEKDTKKFAPGTVVWHPGGTLVSHYAVHCINNGIPIVCRGGAPQIGESLDPSPPIPELSQEDYERIAQYMVAYDEWTIAKMAALFGNHMYAYLCSAVRFSTAAMHSCGFWGSADHLLRLRAAGIIFTYRAAAAAILGEFRHFASGPLRIGMKPYTESIDIFGTDLGIRRVERDDVYNVAVTFAFHEIAKYMKTLVMDFLQPGWLGGYGGHSWAKCCAAELRLARKMATFVKKPSKATYVGMVEAWNYIIDVTHNNGALLTKYANAHMFDTCGVAPALYMVEEATYDVIFAGPETVQTLKNVKKIGRFMMSATVKKRGETYERRDVEIPKVIDTGETDDDSYPTPVYDEVVDPDYKGDRFKRIHQFTLIPTIHVQGTTGAFQNNRPYGFSGNVAVSTDDMEKLSECRLGEVRSLTEAGAIYAKCVIESAGNHARIKAKNKNGEDVIVVGAYTPLGD